MKATLILMLSSILLASCGDSRMSSKLSHIEQLLQADSIAEAAQEINDIDATRLAGKDLKARYCLLYTMVNFRNGKVMNNDSLVNHSIAYYEMQGNNKMLAQALYYKARTMMLRGDTKTSFSTLLRAERVANKCDDKALLAKIITNKAIIFLNGNELEKALETSNKAMTLAHGAGDKVMAFYALEAKANAYGYMGNIDSARAIMMQCEPFICSLNEDERAHAYANLAAAYEGLDNSKARDMALKAIAVKPTGNAYHILGKMEQNLGHEAIADSLYAMAMASAESFSRKIDVLDDWASMLRARGQYKEADDMRGHMLAMKDSLVMQRHNDSISAIQDRYAYSNKLREIEQDKANWTSIASVLLAVLAAVSWLYVFFARKTKVWHQQLADTIDSQTATISRQSNCIDALSGRAKQLSDRLKASKRRAHDVEQGKEMHIAAMKAVMEQTADKGQKIVARIKGGEPHVLCMKEDIESLTAYYEIIHPSFMRDVCSRYSGITRQQKAYLILSERLHLDDAAIAVALGVKLTSLRAIKSRLARRETVTGIG